MTRIFIFEKIDAGQDEIRLGKEQQKYLKNVLRLVQGDVIIVCDTNMTDFICSINSFASDEVSLKIVERHKNDSEPSYRVVLFQSISKGERMDYTIQKSVELGVDTIVPVESARTIVKVKDKDGSGKIDRWSKIALEACRQSGRGKVVEVKTVERFQNALEMAISTTDLVIIPWEKEANRSLGQVIDSYLADFYEKREKSVCEHSELSGDLIIPKPSISIFIGPEGGYEDEEVEIAIQSGAIPVTLGKRILRTETAGPSVLAMLLYRFELN